MYPEEDYIQLSAIQHYVFCPRQCGLIHIEGQWAENLFTTRGKIMHERVDSAEDETSEINILREALTSTANGWACQAGLMWLNLMIMVNAMYPTLSNINLENQKII